MAPAKDSGIVHFTPLGGGREIGANCFAVQIGGALVLLDCGMHPKEDGYDALPDFSLLSRAPDAVIISHAHLDHCGALPYLLKQFPAVIPFATKPTVDVMDRMLHNSVSVMEMLARDRGIDAYPLYYHRDVEFAIRRIYGIDLNNEFAISSKHPVRVTFEHAGHVLGSAAIRLSTPEHTVYYTGDVCVYDQELMGKFVPPENGTHIDTLIVESTNGAREEGDTYTYAAESRRFGRAVRAVLESGHSVLIAAFALGRTQEMLNMLVRLRETGIIPKAPMYASGLGRAVYELYMKHEDNLREGANLVPLSEFERVGNVWEEPAALEELLRDPSIIVATSGMMIENTPSAVIAEAMVQEEGHGIFFVGYCDPDTLGAKLQAAKKGHRLQFQLGNSPVEITNENIRSFRFSAHAARHELRHIVEKIDAKNVLFVHGDVEAIEWMHHHCGDGAYKFMPEVGKTLKLKPAAATS